MSSEDEWRGECDGREGMCELMVWCGEKEECQCVVIHSIPGILMWSVWIVVDEWMGKKGGLEESG